MKLTEKRLLPPLTALRAFEAAARHMSFKLAANEMHVTASAVSHAVAALESFLGIKLFHRRTRKLLLTDAGIAYLTPVSRAFDAIGAATREVAGRSHADILTVVCSPTFSRTWLIPRLGEFLDLYPDIDLRLLARIEAVLPAQPSAMGGQRELGELLHSEVDAAIVYGRGGWQGFVVDQLIDEVMVPLCTPALRDNPPPLREPADLTGHVLIYTETKFVSWAMWLEAAGVKDVKPKRVVRFNRADMAIHAALSGLGVALENRVIAAQYLASGALVIPFDLTVPLDKVAAYYFLCRPEKATLPKVESFRDWLTRAARATQEIEEGA
jgi:LysR family transcriptional regulator, glycine cleavage system transcriptional activator